MQIKMTNTTIMTWMNALTVVSIRYRYSIKLQRRNVLPIRLERNFSTIFYLFLEPQFKAGGTEVKENPISWFRPSPCPPLKRPTNTRMQISLEGFSGPASDVNLSKSLLLVSGNLSFFRNHILKGN